MSHPTKDESRRALARERKRRSREKNATRYAEERAVKRAQMHPCACGCGTDIPGTAQFSPGHQNRASRSPEEYEADQERQRQRDRDYQRSWRETNPEKHAQYLTNFKESEAYERAKQRAREQYQANPDATWEAHVLRKFGLTANDYFTMLEVQGGGCAICGELKPGGRPRADGQVHLAVDHCHTTGKVRGLLCQRCNTIIGKANDSVVLLRVAMNYLEHAA